MDFLRRLFGRTATTGDEELGGETQLNDDLTFAQAVAQRRGTIIPSTTDQLTTFRFLVGIISNPSMQQSASVLRSAKRPATNLGIYRHVVDNERNAKRSYKFYSRLINSCLGLQIIVAAALTALGASNSSSGAVTVFGAINTVIAGFLTYLKGSGLPNRLKYYQNEWSKIREFIEQQERAFSREGCTLDLYKVVATIEIMYEEVKSDVESNQPDHYISQSKLRSSTLPSVTVASNSFLTNNNKDGTAGKPSDRLNSYLDEKTADVESRVEGKVDETSKNIQNYGEKTREIIQDYGEKTTEDIRDYGQSTTENIQSYGDATAENIRDYETATEAELAQARRAAQDFAGRS